MKVKFNRNVKHDGRLYEAGKVYDFDGALSDDVKELLTLVHEDVHTQKATNEVERRETVQVAEEVSADVPAEPQPAPVVKTAPIGAAAVPPAPSVQG